METHQIIESGHPEKTTVDIKVNNKPVILHKLKVTGREIKVAAIEQGIAIELDFLLYIVRGHEQLDPVRDDEQVTVHEDERFRAVAPDDVSEV